jgi:alpha-tubulin suppressor-like RCC1 family protein
LQGTDLGDGTFDADEADVLAPIRLTGLPEDVVDVAGGARWAVALTESGAVWAWGPNDEGPTGGLDGDPALETEASFFPTRVAELDDVHVVEIRAGPNSILAADAEGRVYGRGSNSDGRFGFASDGPLHAPVEIAVGGPADPILVTAGPATTPATSRPTRPSR